MLFLGALIVVLSMLSEARADETPVGEPFTIDPGPADTTRPAVAYDSQRQEFWVTWGDGAGDIDTVIVSLDGSQVTQAWGRVSAERPAIAYNPAENECLVVYQTQNGSHHDILGMRLDPWSAYGPFVIASGPTDQKNPAVAYNSHSSYQDYLVVWEDTDPTWVPAEQKIFAQRVAGVRASGTGGGELIGGQLIVASTDISVEPDVAYNLNMNEYLVVYTRVLSNGSKDIWCRRITRDGVLLIENAIDDSDNDQEQPSVAAYRLNSSTPYLVAFSDYWNDPSGDVRAYLVSQEGVPQTLINIAHLAGTEELGPDVVSDEARGGYTVVWNQYNADYDVHGRWISHEGAPGQPFNASVHGLVSVPCHEQSPVVSSGSSVALAVWRDSCLGGGGGWKIAGRRLADVIIFADGFESSDTTRWSSSIP